MLKLMRNVVRKQVGIVFKKNIWVNSLCFFLLFGLTSAFTMPLASFADDTKMRAFHLPLGSAGQKDYIISTIDKLNGKFNTLIIMVNNKLMYERYPEISSSVAENMNQVMPGGLPMSKKDLREIVVHAKKKGLDVIPEVGFLTHQEKFLRRTHPELMVNEVTCDPLNTKVAEIEFAVIDELIEIFKPRFFHIGLDEMREFWRKTPSSNSKIPAYKDFAYEANKLAAYLKKKGVTPMMWGDMLLNPAEFNVSNAMIRNFKGNLQDYYKAIDLLDKSIIIVDWHYSGDDKNFPSVDYFLAKGFRVVGATHNNRTTTENFSKYLCGKNNPGALGMMATTWHEFNIRNTVFVDQIIADSAKAFSVCGR